jgi:hypothetical protein
MGFELDANAEPNPDRDGEMNRIEALLGQTLALIHDDGAEVFGALNDQQEWEVRQAENEAAASRVDGASFENYVLDDKTAQIGIIYWDLWEEEQRLPVGLRLVKGACLHLPHAWFEIWGNPGILCDPQARWVIDPYPRGLMTPNRLIEPLVVTPHSPFQLVYKEIDWETGCAPEEE